MTRPPLPDAKTVRPFAYSDALITRISLGLSAYILLCLYPAYGLLRGWWLDDFSTFSGAGLMVVVATSSAFGIFARWTMLKYLRIDG
jgi:hypothetical protein